MSDGVLHYFGTNVLGGLKEGTAVSANRLLRRAGVFWQRESRDHVVRNSDELDRIILYVLEKIAEIPVRHRINYAYLGVLMAGLMYGFFMYIKANPDIVRPYLFMS